MTSLSHYDGVNGTKKWDVVYLEDSREKRRSLLLRYGMVQGNGLLGLQPLTSLCPRRLKGTTTSLPLFLCPSIYLSGPQDSYSVTQRWRLHPLVRVSA